MVCIGWTTCVPSKQQKKKVFKEVVFVLYSTKELNSYSESACFHSTIFGGKMYFSEKIERSMWRPRSCHL